MPHLETMTAGMITENPAPPKASLRGAVVMVGASFADSRDLYPTPFGTMPGALIIINALNSLMQHGQLHPPATWALFVVGTLLIALMAYIVAVAQSVWRLLLWTSILLILIVPMSFFAFQHGVWLNFVMPLLAVQLHCLARRFEDSFRRPKGAPP